MIAIISPTTAHVKETLSMLPYVSQACSIINVAKVNEDSSAVLIRGMVLRSVSYQPVGLGLMPTMVQNEGRQIMLVP